MNIAIPPYKPVISREATPPKPPNFSYTMGKPQEVAQLPPKTCIAAYLKTTSMGVQLDNEKLGLKASVDECTKAVLEKLRQYRTNPNNIPSNLQCNVTNQEVELVGFGYNGEAYEIRPTQQLCNSAEEVVQAMNLIQIPQMFSLHSEV